MLGMHYGAVVNVINILEKLRGTGLRASFPRKRSCWRCLLVIVDQKNRDNPLTSSSVSFTSRSLCTGKEHLQGGTSTLPNPILSNTYLYLFCTKHKITWGTSDLVPTVLYVHIRVGRVSVVSIVTHYGLDGQGIDYRWGARFSAPVHSPLYNRHRVSFPG